MTRRRPEVADVIRKHGAEYLQVYGKSTAAHRHVLRNLCSCRTAALGGHTKRCDSCGHEQIAYNSCRNRHCPKCQAMARAAWLEAREAELLDTQYFHVVFTLPDDLGPLALQNKRLLYGMLFRAASETLLTVARDSKHLGAHIGFFMILHTWGQKLDHHPHVHVVVPGGGISLDGNRWVACRRDFLLPVRVLSRLFRAKLVAFLAEAFAKQRLRFHGQLVSLSQADSWSIFLRRLRGREWVVYAKPPFGGPRQVLKYLARYTHRVAISNQRLVSVDDDAVTFRWKDYAHHNRRCIMKLGAVEFIRRFLLHVLPVGFMRIRYYGFLANRARRKKLALCRTLLGQATPPPSDEETDVEPQPMRCPACKNGRLVVVMIHEPRERHDALAAPVFDTS